VVSRADLFGWFAEEHLALVAEAPTSHPKLASRRERALVAKRVCTIDCSSANESTIRSETRRARGLSSAAVIARVRVWRNERRRRVEDLSGRPRARDHDDRVISAAGGHLRGREGVALAEHLLVPVCSGRLGDVERVPQPTKATRALDGNSVMVDASSAERRHISGCVVNSCSKLLMMSDLSFPG